jgi:hypothetical protein
MKRPLQPVDSYAGDEDYPSSQDVWLSRRAFLGRSASTVAVAAAGAAVGAVGLGGVADAAPGAKDKRKQITIHLSRYTQIAKSGMRAEKLVIFTGNKDLDRFLRKSAEQSRVKRALMKRLQKVKPETLLDGRKLYRLERSLGGIVVGQYRKRTGKSARQPDVMLSLTRFYGYRRLGGVRIRPRRPRRPRVTP